MYLFNNVQTYVLKDTVISTKQNILLTCTSNFIYNRYANIDYRSKIVFMGLRCRVQSPLKDCPLVVWDESKNGTPMSDSYIGNTMFLPRTGLFATGQIKPHMCGRYIIQPNQLYLIRFLLQSKHTLVDYFLPT